MFDLIISQTELPPWWGFEVKLTTAQRASLLSPFTSVFYKPSHHSLQEMARRIGVEKLDLATAKSEDVVFEIFHSMVREIRDEVRNFPTYCARVLMVKIVAAFWFGLMEFHVLYMFISIKV